MTPPRAAASPADSPAGSHAATETFDIVIAGAGAAGCVLANRLSADPACRVLLLEAGGRDDSIWFRIPVGYRQTIGNPRTDWCFASEPEPHLGGRVLKHPRGKVLGGSTAINGMVAIRGQRADYDAWRDDFGLEGWGWDDVLPWFKRHEHHHGGACDLHGEGGEWSVSQARMHWPLLDAVRDAAVQAGIPATHDFNDGASEGVGPIHVNQREGRRWSAADAFLKPVRHRANLVVRTEALVDRVLVEGGRATGIAYRHGGQDKAAFGRAAVVLAAGAFGTPAILLRSGIGPAAALQAQGIRPLLDRPGVGANLQDHLQIGLRYRLSPGVRTLNAGMNSALLKAGFALRWALTRQGPLTMAPCQIGLFARSSPEVERADLGYNVLAFSRARFDAPFDPFPGLTMIVYDLRPTSRGSVTLPAVAPADPAAAPRIVVNFLATERDRRVAANAIRLTRRIVRQPALAGLGPEEIWDGASARDDDEAALVAAAAANGTSIFHPVGTARMGRAGDAQAVVDARLRVQGLQGLRVIDASVMPTLISGNTATPTVMIADKGAHLLLDDLRSLRAAA